MKLEKAQNDREIIFSSGSVLIDSFIPSLHRFEFSQQPPREIYPMNLDRSDQSVAI